MQPSQWNTAGAIVAGLTLALAVVAAEIPKDPVKGPAKQVLNLNVKPGLWEIASQGGVSGAPPIPPEMLARMSDEQRARYEAAMQNAMANASKPRLGKSCLTPEQVANGLDFEHTGSQNCQKTIVTNTATELVMSEQCAQQDGSYSIDEHFKLSGSGEVNGTVHVAGNRGGKSFTVDRTLHAQWLGASCGDIKDYQPEK